MGERRRVNLGAIGQDSVQFAEHLSGIIERDVALRDIVNYAGQYPISAIHGFVEVVLDIPHEVANQELGRVPPRILHRSERGRARTLWRPQQASVAAATS